MAEAQLRKVWAGLMPTFPEPATLLDVSDPDDRAITMLLKTLYVVFKGVLEERHQLSCSEHRTSSAEPRTTAAEPRNNSTGPGATAAGSGAVSVEELVPSSPGDLVPPSPGNVTYFSQTRRTSAASAPPPRPALLVPETVDIPSLPRAGRLPRPVTETVPPPPPPPAVWVPETLETSPMWPGHRPCPVAETVPPPSTPPRSLRQSEAVSPVLPGRSPASRRARRAASRTGAVSSPAPFPPLLPPPPLPLMTLTLAETTTKTAAATAAAAAGSVAEKGREVAVSPTPSLSSPLLLPQRLPDRSRRPAVAEATLAESPKGRKGGAVVGSFRGTSRLSRTKLSQTGGNSTSAPAQGASKARQPPVKKRKYMFIGPNDPVPPRKPRGAVAASPQKSAQQEAAPQESSSTLAPHKRPPDQPASRSGPVSPTRSSARAAAAVTPTKTSAQSIFELSATASAAQQRSTSSKGHTSNSESVAGKRTPPKRTPPKRTPTPKKSAEQRGGSAPAGAAGRPASSAESVVELEVLLEELDHVGVQTQAQGQGGGQTQRHGQDGGQTQRHEQDGGQERNPGRDQTQGDSRDQAEFRPGDGDRGRHQAASWPKQRGDTPDREDLHAHGDIGAEPEETTAPRDDAQPEHESQEETQMDSLVFSDQQSAAGPAYKYDAGPVRRQADRQKLPGWSCTLCKEWYSDRDMTEEQLQAHMNRCSRHRQKEPPPPDTPPGFWDPVGFPSMNITQYGNDGPRTRARRKL